jgi:phenylacetate-CoA ligase
MYWFGKFLQSHERPWEQDSEWNNLLFKRQILLKTSIVDLINLLDEFSRLWGEGGSYFEDAYNHLAKSNNLSANEIYKTLSVIPALLCKENLERRVRSEFNPVELLDKFSKTPSFNGQVRAMPLGILLHVTAGNVFLSSIDSLIMGILTKNLNIVKVSSSNLFFPLFFVQKLNDFDKEKIISDKISILNWTGGDQSIEKIFKKRVDGIVAWGGEEMIQSYSQDLSPEVKFLKFGPKISIQVITIEGMQKKDLSVVAKKIVEDIIPWDQSACSSPQNLYIQEGVEIQSLLTALSSQFKVAPKTEMLDADVAVEIQKEFYRAKYSELMEDGKCIRGDNYLLHFEKNKFLRPSPLNRSLIIKTFKDENDLLAHLKSFSYYLQSCSYLFGNNEKESFLETLALAGIKRFAPLGTITMGMEGAPHDGYFVMREMTKFVGLEDRIVDYGEDQKTLSDSKTLKGVFEASSHPKGYIFSSGGTTGEPKYVHFSYEEFEHITEMLAFNLSCQGVRAGMKVANLFVAGNLWSSFVAMDRALEKLGVIQLPIGGLCSQENIINYLKKFQPDVVLGIPSLLIMNAEFSRKHDLDINVPMIFYAGEALSESRREYLEKTWRTQYFGSAGYASVDAGVIAYQCPDCLPGEHHVFSNLVEVKIIDGEAVVNSLYRKTMPIVNYRTGDRIEWVSNNCKVTDKKFKLVGRTDNLLQLWSCRLNLDDILLSLKEVYPDVKTFQLVIKEEKVDEEVQEFLELWLENADLRDAKGLKESLYSCSRDLRDTLSFATFDQYFKIITVKEGEIERNGRTGKLSLIKDLRKM